MLFFKKKKINSHHSFITDLFFINTGWSKSHASELHRVCTKSTLFDRNIMSNVGNDHHEHLCTDPSSRACYGTLDGELQLKYFRFLR